MSRRARVVEPGYPHHVTQRGNRRADVFEDYVDRRRACVFCTRALRDGHTVYAMHFNGRSKTTGHVWQGRFYSCPLDEAHLWRAVRYVERNPVRTGLVERCEHYKWSSARAHCGLTADGVLTPLPGRHGIEDWSQWLALAEGAAWYPGWSATVDGEPVSIYLADDVLRPSW